MIDVPQFLPTRAAAAYCGLSPRSLEKYRVSGNGPRFVRPRGHRFVRYSRDDLDAWMREGRRSATRDYESPTDAA